MRDDPEGRWDAYAREFGVRLHRTRVAVGLTQEDLAHAAGITRSHYQQLEKGLSRPGVAANPSLRTLISLARALGVRPEELIPRLDDDGSTARRSAR
ncbi:helix-turn-helix domain-containing protein [Protaetiibacter larvae]|uniref:Helix-turn-helix transcriptional regulator n=1 Tax=Protaetiibacter larvae TaxID=2592654 RepID=A0A5C1YC21_9MICO|nr:helix-turn-helix transcriptional regulator [Protaetiibacter larvae]QEO10629.1 helix-turn-helix transcriptional regulator [Protaetiibacter larvae]